MNIKYAAKTVLFWILFVAAILLVMVFLYELFYGKVT